MNIFFTKFCVAILLSCCIISFIISSTGIEDGQTVRMPVGKREIFITFRVEKSDYFRRDGSDIHTDANMSLSQAALGGTVRIQGIYEDQTIQVHKFYS